MYLEMKNAVTKRISEEFSPKAEVYTQYVEQGFKEPCFFVDMFPIATNLINAYIEEDIVNFNITYYPLADAQDEFIDVAKRLRSLFMYNVLDVCDRHLLCETMTFNLANGRLEVVFSYRFKVEVDTREETYEDMGSIEIGGNI